MSLTWHRLLPGYLLFAGSIGELAGAADAMLRGHFGHYLKLLSTSELPMCIAQSLALCAGINCV